MLALTEQNRREMGRQEIIKIAGRKRKGSGQRYRSAAGHYGLTAQRRRVIYVVTPVRARERWVEVTASQIASQISANRAECSIQFGFSGPVNSMTSDFENYSRGFPKPWVGGSNPSRPTIFSLVFCDLVVSFNLPRVGAHQRGILPS